MTKAQSGKALGQEYLGRIQAYLNQTESLPLLTDGSLNMSAIASAADIPRQSLYKNPAIRSLLESAKTNCKAPIRHEDEARANVAGIPTVTRESKQTKALERRVNQLEQQNAALVAENAELRRQLKAMRLQMGREDMTIETGRRIPTPPGAHA
jgi:hypothetical protein